ncbi:MAG: arsenite efflux transporter metallochaperone ArsD [Bacilli bacterium]
MKLELFEKALCCSTGVCGPSVDENLLRITGIFESLNKVESIEATRYNLSSTPKAFTENPLILKVLKEKGKDALPITVVADEIVKIGAYPTNEELQKYTGIILVEANTSNSCCGGSGTC